jgi:pimeloyl-ACP methyl ester carboxylesterase
MLENLRPAVRSQEQAAEALGVNRGHIAVCWTFTTQSIGDVLESVHSGVTSRFSAAIGTGMNTGDLGLGLPGYADISAGVVEVVYFLDAADPLNGFWRGSGDTPLTAGNPVPERRSVETIPFLLTIPNISSKPAGGWPVVVFQHGITRNRTDMLAVADAMAAAGFATIAIDLPLHGVTDQTSPFYVSGRERTFDLDFVDNATGAPGSDGVIDDSGTFFINLGNLLNSRDNARQAVADLFGLVAALPDLDIDGDGGDFDADHIVFLGHSLGGMVGTAFLAVESGVEAGAIVAGGGGLMKLLEGSPAFGPVIVGGLAAAGLEQGTAEYEAYLVVAQTVFDSADPVNYGAAAAASQPLFGLMMEGDLVVPNDVVGAPLSGTLPLFAAMGISPVHATTATTLGSVTFVGGDHGSLLDPTASLPVTLEIQSSIAGFFATGGSVIPITDASVIR